MKDKHVLLFTSSSCNLCKLIKPKIKKYCNDNNLDLIILNDGDDNFSYFANKWIVNFYPTIILNNKKYEGVKEIENKICYI